MRFIPAMCASFMCLILMSCAGQHRAASESGAAAGDRFLINEFPIMSWEVPWRSEKKFTHGNSGIESLADCGYTVAGFVRPQHLKTCERLGLKAIVGPDGMPVKWWELSDEQI